MTVGQPKDSHSKVTLGIESLPSLAKLKIPDTQNTSGMERREVYDGYVGIWMLNKLIVALWRPILKVLT